MRHFHFCCIYQLTLAAVEGKLGAIRNLRSESSKVTIATTATCRLSSQPAPQKCSQLGMLEIMKYREVFDSWIFEPD